MPMDKSLIVVQQGELDANIPLRELVKITYFQILGCHEPDVKSFLN